MYDLVVCAIFKNESHILYEWIRHYLFHGVDHIYLVNDHSTDAFQEIIDRFPDTVTLFHNTIVTKDVGRQGQIANKYFLPLRDTSKWMTVLDLDEFLYSPYEVDLRKVLEKYNGIDQLKIDWLHFGSNDHVLQPHVVTEGFVRRAPLDRLKPYYSHKTIVNPRHVVQFGIHEHVVRGSILPLPTSDLVSAELVINHYNLQSEDFFMKVKATRGDINNWFDHAKLKRDRAFFNGYDINTVLDTRLAEQNRPLSLDIKQAKVKGTETVTLVITSCNRPTQLDETLRSFLEHNTYPIERTLLIDDSGLQGCNRTVVDKYRDRLRIEEIYNKTNIGQVQSIDKVYSYVTTPYIFHCEEDWQFLKPAFIEKSFALFRALPDEKLFTVWLRAFHDTSAHPIVQDDKGLLMKKDFSYVDDGVTYTWGGITFNPGLRKTSVCFLHHPYMTTCEPTVTKVKTYIGEYSVNTKYRTDGYYSRILPEPSGYVRHIGGDVHIPREWEVQPTPLTVVSGFWPVKSKHASYLKWFEHTLKINCPYVFFSTKEGIEIIKRFRGSLPTHYIEYSIEEFETFQYKDKMITHPIDCPSVELNLIWNEKVFLLQKAKRLNPFQSDWFQWMDAGICIYRDEAPPSRVYPDPIKLVSLPKNKCIYSSSLPFDRTYVTPTNYYHHIAGTTYILHKDFVDSFASLYKNALDMFVGPTNLWTDQVILTHLYAYKPHLFHKLCDGYGEVTRVLYGSD